ncbi:hypothetical protein FFF34_005890 [Inquilinus sp. KBS0705]|nr:hypothetical protein FFF34_005890 [Inquilinus sp. KBS0705]
MLKIDLPSNISHNVFEQYGLPKLPNGTDMEINGDVILLFDSEEQAVAYLDELEDHSSSLDNDTPEKGIINTLVSVISNDEFVQTYLQ